MDAKFVRIGGSLKRESLDPRIFGLWSRGSCCCQNFCGGRKDRVVPVRFGGWYLSLDWYLCGPELLFCCGGEILKRDSGSREHNSFAVEAT